MTFVMPMHWHPFYYYIYRTKQTFTQMKKATSILVLVFLFLANASFAHGRHGGCSSNESSCCSKKMDKCCKKEMKTCGKYHEASSCGYCQNKNHDCGQSCNTSACSDRTHHCEGCYQDNDRNGMVEFNRCDHKCDGCHPMDRW